MIDRIHLLIVTMCAALVAGGPARAAEEAMMVDTGHATVRSSLAADRVRVTIVAAPGAKLSGEFGVTILPGEEDRTIWAVPLPHVVTAPTPYFEEGAVVSLPFRERKGRTSIQVEYGVCTADEVCIPETVALSFQGEG